MLQLANPKLVILKHLNHLLHCLLAPARSGGYDPSNAASPYEVGIAKTHAFAAFDFPLVFVAFNWFSRKQRQFTPIHILLPLQLNVESHNKTITCMSLCIHISQYIQ